MNLYPAIDLKNGKCIRLKKGSLDKATHYNVDPIEQAENFFSQGAKWIHIVDIDGAFKGTTVNHNVIFKIKKKIHCKIQVGGGIRKKSTVEKFINYGIDRIVLGTKAIKDPPFLEKMNKQFPNKIAVGIDSRDGMVATDGWAKTTKLTYLDLAKEFENLGVSTCIFTDIDRDGMMEGVNLEQTKCLLSKSELNLIISGGVSNITDLVKIKKINTKKIIGVIVGKALYEKQISVVQAIKILERQSCIK